jgi:hypothetical protein
VGIPSRRRACLEAGLGLLRLRRRRDGIPAPLVTHRCPRPAVAESIPEQRSARGQSRLIESLGISLPCQVISAKHADGLYLDVPQLTATDLTARGQHDRCAMTRLRIVLMVSGCHHHCRPLPRPSSTARPRPLGDRFDG